MSITKYITGYLLSLTLTLAAFGLVELHISSSHEWPPHSFVIPAIIIFALLQFAVQAICFLHLGSKKYSLERAFVLGGACLVVAILVGGSLWIMSNLAGRMTLSPSQEMQYMQDQDGF